MITDKMRRKVQRSRGSHSRTGIKSRNGIWNSIGIQLGRTFLKLGDFFFYRFSRLSSSILFSLWFCIFTFVPPKCYVNFFHLFYVPVANSIFYPCFLSTDMFGRYAVETQNKEFAVNRLSCCSGTRFTDSQCILWSKTTHSPCTGSHSQQSKEHQIL